VRRECLDHLLIFGERQLQRVVREYVFDFNSMRPHQGLKQQIPKQIKNANVEKAAANKIIPFPTLKDHDPEELQEALAKTQAIAQEAKGKVIAFPILHGLHHDYRRVA
jgi:hypothetical protein